MSSMLLEWDIITKIGDFLNGNFMNTLKNFLAIIPKLIYFIVACVLSIIDLFQVMFRKLAGLDPIMISGETVTGDSIYKILMDALFTGKYPAISTAFWSLIILGIFMLLITSIIATIRVEYNPDKEKGNSKSAIIKNFFKALFSFAIVPIACIFGMALTNSLVGVIDSVTLVEIDQNDQVYSNFEQWQGISGTSSGDDLLMGNKTSYIAYDVFGITIPTTAEPFSGIVFKASGYSANRFRLYGNGYLDAVSASGTDLGIFSTGQIGDYETAAQIVDTGFAINAKLKGGTYNLIYTDSIKDFGYSASMQLFGSKSNIGNFSKYNVELVWYFYDLWTFNYIIAFVAVMLIGKMYFNFCLTLMARVFEIAGLFLVAPVAISIMPMDGGGALDRWRKTFVGKFGLIIVMVFGLNIISPILSVIQGVKLFNLPLLDYFVLAFFIVAALSAVNGLNETISKILFDKASAYDKDAKIAGATFDNVKSGLGATMTAGKLVTAPAALAGRAAGYGVGKAANAIRNGYRNRQDGRIDDNLRNRLNNVDGSEQQRLNNLDNELSSFNAQKDAEEIAEIQSTIQYDKATAEQDFDTMSSEDRRGLADDFLATQQGIAFANKYYGGDTSAAKRSILYDGKPGKQKWNFGDSDAKEAVAKFAHDRIQFARTKAGSQYEEGSSAYRQAMGAYARMTDDEKLRAHIGGAPLTDRQRQIQAERAAEEQRIQALRTEAQEFAAQRRKKAEEEAQEEHKKLQEKREGKRGIKKIAGETNEKVIKPITNQTNGSIQSLINLIPGAQLFQKPKKNDK